MGTDPAERRESKIRRALQTAAVLNRRPRSCPSRIHSRCRSWTPTRSAGLGREENGSSGGSSAGRGQPGTGTEPGPATAAPEAGSHRAASLPGSSPAALRARSPSQAPAAPDPAQPLRRSSGPRRRPGREVAAHLAEVTRSPEAERLRKLPHEPGSSLPVPLLPGRRAGPAPRVLQRRLPSTPLPRGRQRAPPRPLPPR